MLPWPQRAGHGTADNGVVYPFGDPADWEYALTPYSEKSLVEVVLEPGDFLYVPAGAYHKTSALTDHSIGLHFKFQPTSFFELLISTLRSSFEANSSWRHIPLCANSARTDAMTPPIREFFNQRLIELRAMLDSLKPDGPELHAAWKMLIARSDGDAFRAQPSGVQEVAQDDHLRFYQGAPTLRAVVTNAENRREIHIYNGSKDIWFDQPNMLAFADQLFEHRSGFRAGDATRWAGPEDPYSWAEIKEVLETLLNAAVLEKRNERS